MSSDIAIKVEGLSKCYQIYDQPRDRLKQFILPKLQGLVRVLPKKYYKDFWALKDISFQVNKGETVGIIGRNGSGKSTLLQMICGTLDSTSGEISTNGRIAALLELGSGFNPEFTGRENVYLNASVLGLTNDEIDARFDDIAAFADIGTFIEQPVKIYSSGMMVRLAFAVAINVKPNILIVDEALSVGDIRFQTKCMRKIESIKENGASILFVSHSPSQIEALCDRAIWIEQGRIKFDEKPSKVMRKYINFIEHGIDERETEAIKEFNEKDNTNRNHCNSKQSENNIWTIIDGKFNTTGDERAIITKVLVSDEGDLPLTVIKSSSQKINVKFNIQINQDISSPLIAIGIFNVLNEPLIHFNTEQIQYINTPYQANQKIMFTAEIMIPALQPNEYLISIGVDDGFIGSNKIVFHLYDAWKFSVVSGKTKKTQAGYIQLESSQINLNHEVL